MTKNVSQSKWCFDTRLEFLVDAHRIASDRAWPHTKAVGVCNRLARALQLVVDQLLIRRIMWGRCGMRLTGISTSVDGPEAASAETSP